MKIFSKKHLKKVKKESLDATSIAVLGRISMSASIERTKSKKEFAEQVQKEQRERSAVAKLKKQLLQERGEPRVRAPKVKRQMYPIGTFKRDVAHLIQLNHSTTRLATVA